MTTIRLWTSLIRIFLKEKNKELKYSEQIPALNTVEKKETFLLNNVVPLQVNFPSLQPVNILTIADTHGYRENLIDEIKNMSEEKYDIVFTLGDIPLEMLRDIKTYSKKEVFGVLGNHDTENLLKLAGIPSLDKNLVTINGVTFTGISGSFKYKPSCIGFSHEESQEFFKNVKKSDVLISHDTINELFKNLYGAFDIAHQGLEGIKTYMEDPKVKINIHGHYHRNLQWQNENKYVLSCYGLNLISINNNSIVKNVLYEI